MNRTKISVLLILLLTMALTACAAATPTETTVTNNSTSSSQSTDALGINKLNLNTVTGDELLVAIPNFSSRMVREFHEYRPYLSIQQFRREIGKYVGDAQVAEYEKYVYVPISVNDSDAETLKQIPGLDATEVEAVIAGRPYAFVDDFLARLSGFVSADELEIAKTYLGDN
jgi:DNA uptake protein ComE-like DNA-binding protein